MRDFGFTLNGAFRLSLARRKPVFAMWGAFLTVAALCMGAPGARAGDAGDHESYARVPAAEADAADPLPGGQYVVPWFEVFGTGGDLGGGGGFRSILAIEERTNSLLFLGLDGVFLDTGSGVFDAGAYLGWRRAAGGTWVLGAWTGFDVQNSRYDNTFARFVGGVEATSADWILRASMAIPFDDESLVSDRQSQSTSTRVSSVTVGGATKRTLTTTTTVTGTTVIEQAPQVWDAEIGSRLHFDLLGNGGLNDELRLFAGGYVLDHFGDNGTVAGGRVRAELDIYPFESRGSDARVTFEGEYAYDDVQKDQWRGTIRFAVPLQNVRKEAAAGSIKDPPAPVTVTRAELYQPVRRNMEVLTALKTRTNTVSTTTTASTTTFDGSKLCTAVTYTNLAGQTASIPVAATGINLKASIPTAADLPKILALAAPLQLEVSADGLTTLSMVSFTAFAGGCRGQTITKVRPPAFDASNICTSVNYTNASGNPATITLAALGIDIRAIIPTAADLPKTIIPPGAPVILDTGFGTSVILNSISVTSGGCTPNITLSEVPL